MHTALIVVLFALVVVSGCTSNEQAVNPLVESNEAPSSAAQDQAELLQIEQQLRGALVNGQISPDTYSQLDKQLMQLEAKGLDTKNARQMLSQLQVGGQEPQQDTTQQNQPSKPIGLFNQECDNKSVSKFAFSPLDLNNLRFIEPQGRMKGSHVTHVDHQYWQPVGFQHSSPENDVIKYGIKSPADGYVIQVGKFKENDYRIIIEHSCELYTILIHINELSSKILTTTDGTNSKMFRIPVGAGEVIGRKNSYTFDVSVHDTNVRLSGFVFPEHYDEVWKIHTVDPFDYFAEPVRTQLREKSLRSAEPVGGKIDYDIPGTIQGNWFLEGTGWYKDTCVATYWRTHLAIAYDHINPTQIRISFGDYEGTEADFGVKDNAPLPSEVTVQSGIIKYELVNYEYLSGSYVWDALTQAKLTARNKGEVKGTLLVQNLGNNKIKIEIFPGKTASQVADFTSSAKTYER